MILLYIFSFQWIYLLWQINEVIHCYKTEEIDIVVVAEVALRLSEILETLGNPKGKFKRTQGRILNKKDELHINAHIHI